MRITKPILLLAGAVMVASAAEAQSPPTIEKVVESGKQQEIQRIVGLDVDCRPIPRPAINLL